MYYVIALRSMGFKKMNTKLTITGNLSCACYYHRMYMYIFLFNVIVDRFNYQVQFETYLLLHLCVLEF